ncbi:uncharacterized protein DUF4391 [Anoxybacillus vitaminiphilus]|uniref:Uncharacterized protein DUF4391 n=1 Tax=Paranoxybacillus vitaminiphilus TaxID=581036 RepID=A0A327XZJ5_9BACL|nr:DUF4391 domain-containing protein [Anoxybacillus vitaminiphilus]RAK14180.1 uncharacterized protein DUF4391 [Anoxybacillus vitaminiphilus]
MAGLTFYRMIGLDDKVRPLNKKLDKKMFYDFADLNKKEKDYITKYIERMELSYLLTPSTINIQPFINEEYHYEGVMFITIQLREEARDNHLPVIGEIIQGALPNPVVIVFEKQGNFQIGTCLKRLNKVDMSQVVLEESYYTPWFQLDNDDETVHQFIKTIHITKISFSHFFRFYKDIHLAVQAFQHTKAVGTFYVAEDEEVQQLIAQIQAHEAEITKWKNKMKKETQFNRKVEYNMKIQQLTKQVEQLKQQLQ